MADPILLVDADDARARDLAGRIRALCHSVPTVVASVAAARDLLDTTPHGLVLLHLDAVTGHVEGSAALKGLRELFLLHPEASIVALVGDLRPEEAAGVLHAGAADVLEVPITDLHLGRQLRHLLDVHGRAKASAERVERRLKRATEALVARRLGAAHAHARRALAVDPLLPAAYNVLGIVAQLRLRIEDAQRLYRTALALDNGFTPARANLVNLTGFPKRLSAFEV